MKPNPENALIVAAGIAGLSLVVYLVWKSLDSQKRLEEK